MSGGSWNYAYEQVILAAEDLLDSDTNPLREKLVAHMLELAEVMKAIEWSDSGDTAFDAWVEKTKNFLDRIQVEKLKIVKKGQ